MKLVRLTLYGIALLAMLLVSVKASYAAPGHDDMADLDAFIAQAMKDYQVPGAAVAIVENGKIVMAKGYGVRDVTKPDLVDADTIFQLASVTKSLTGAAAATQVDAGKLDWDTPITNYLPEFVGYDPYMTRWLTERDLLAMRTGWPALTGDAVDSFGYDRAEIVRRLRYLEPRYSLRQEAQYSNPGIFVAGEVAARVSGLSWNELVQQKIFTPLGMKRSGTVVKGLSDPNLAAPHVLQNGKAVVVERDVLDTTGAASSATASVSDMAQFVLMLLDKGTYNGTTVLKPETVAEMFKRSMVSEIGFTELPPISEATGFYYGLGVDSFDYDGHQIVEKAGALSGVRTIFTMIPDKNVGIVVLDNMNLAPFPEAVRAYFLNQQLGLDTTLDQKEILAANAQIQKLIAPQPAPTNPIPFAGTLQSLVGTYTNDYYGTCEIVLNGQDLSAVCGPAKYTAKITHYNGGAFDMLFPGATQAALTTTFTIGADGTADSFTTDAWGTFTRVKP